MQDQEIYYTLEINASGMKYYAHVNGIRVQEETKGHVLNIDIPINGLVRSGENVIDFELYPWKKTGTLTQRSDAEITLRLKMVNKSSEEKEEFSLGELVYKSPEIGMLGTETTTKSGEFNFPDSLSLPKNSVYKISELDIDKDLEYPGAKRFSLSINMPTPFPEWKFFKSEDITDPRPLTEEQRLQKISTGPYKVLEKIHAGLLKNDVDSILPYFKERNDEMDIAMYLPSGSYEDKLSLSFQESIDDKDIFDELELEYSFPNVTSNKKLVWLGGRPVIYCWDEEETTFTEYETIFRKEGGNWIISR
ncbi:MAG: hypothetical protein HRU20_29915 [Pseudomonadales bacterium]|nr:hypothetical protein [Pseudomonadales bacterium]